MGRYQEIVFVFDDWLSNISRHFLSDYIVFVEYFFSCHTCSGCVGDCCAASQKLRRNG